MTGQEALVSLIVEATRERTHYYVKRRAEIALAAIDRLEREKEAVWRLVHDAERERDIAQALVRNAQRALVEHGGFSEHEVHEPAPRIVEIVSKLRAEEARCAERRVQRDSARKARDRWKEHFWTATSKLRAARKKLAETEGHWEECQTEHHKRNMEVAVARRWARRWKELARFRGWPASRHEKNRQMARRLDQRIQKALTWLRLAPVERRRDEAIAILEGRG